MVVNAELEWIWKKTALVNFKVLKLTVVSDIKEIYSADFELLYAER